MSLGEAAIAVYQMYRIAASLWLVSSEDLRCRVYGRRCVESVVANPFARRQVWFNTGLVVSQETAGHWSDRP